MSGSDRADYVAQDRLDCHQGQVPTPLIITEEAAAGAVIQLEWLAASHRAVATCVARLAETLIEVAAPISEQHQVPGHSSPRQRSN